MSEEKKKKAPKYRLDAIVAGQKVRITAENKREAMAHAERTTPKGKPLAVKVFTC